MIIDSNTHVFLPVDKHLDRMINEGPDKTVLFSTLLHPEKTLYDSEYQDELIRLLKIL